MKLVRLAAVAALCTFPATTVSAALNYNPVVVVVASSAPSSAGAMTSISIYQQGVADQIAPISTTAYLSGTLDPVGSRLVNSGTNVNEGTLTNNPGVSDAAAKGLLYGGTQYVFNGGYDAPLDTPNVASTTPTTAAGANAPRAFGRTNVTNNVASAATVLQTQLTEITVGTVTLKTPYDNSAIRGAVGDDAGTARYTAGTTSNSPQAKVEAGGFRNFADNTLLTTPVNSTNGLHNTRTIELLAGGLFGTGGNSTFNRGIYKLNPAGAVVDATSEPRYIDTGAASGPREFALFDDPNLSVTLNSGYDTAYIADDTLTGGVQKWTWDGAAWTLAYTLADSGLTTYRGLAGQLDAATNLITLYTTEYDGTFSRLQQVTDTGASSTFTTLASLDGSITGSAFRGVALSATAPILTGDYNNNGNVDAADYVLWRDGGPLQNDPTPGVQPADYDVWKANFGNPPGSGSGHGLGSAVPEPGSALLLLLGLAIVRCGRRRLVQ